MTDTSLKSRIMTELNKYFMNRLAALGIAYDAAENIVVDSNEGIYPRDIDEAITLYGINRKQALGAAELIFPNNN